MAKKEEFRFVFSKVADFAVMERDGRYEIWERCTDALGHDGSCLIYHRKVADSDHWRTAQDIAESLTKQANAEAIRRG